MIYSKSQIEENENILSEWEKVIFSEFSSLMNNEKRPFPCLFGVNGFKQDMLRFSFHEELNAKSIFNDLKDYLKNAKNYGINTSFVAFEKPSSIKEVNYYYDKFWNLLNQLSTLDNIKWPSDLPKKLDDPKWEFCFNGEPMFVVCNTPAHIFRQSRRSSTFMLTFQPRWVFDGILDTDKKAQSAFNSVTKRLMPYDLINKSPFLGKYGNHNNREWKQYFLDDLNNEMKCPFHQLSNNEEKS
ncbi:hypothetical protein Xbed_03606 [Xenorhabdus beddingii]|uniref:YqcI/YcgG family protein n=1 Tax=Xenorhabdus beddingii TaxID=40578 RepID=A0A1Y2SC18_9GAMM|nr:YqcI/YcgG family protein [Xenorhabdus beddingii]OTA15305.1 hypothetical protein Xbed_03606 [Xenorhabdus beddingii]